MVPRRDYDRDLYYPKKEVAFDDGRHRRNRSRSKSSLNSQRRRHSKYSNSRDSGSDSDRDSDSDFSAKEERDTANGHKRTLLYTGLATVTTIGALNGLYQSTKLHQARKKQMREGTISDLEAEELKREHRKRDLISLGLAAVSYYNTRNGWRRMKNEQVEAQKVRDDIAIRLGTLPPFLSDLWESLLRAVPKKKTSHRKKRQRFLAGKALQDVTSLNKCSACGNVKRAHLLCPYCVQGKALQYFLPEKLANQVVTEIHDMWNTGRSEKAEGGEKGATKMSKAEFSKAEATS
ncbi:MAG: hypothetical protein Q9182_000353 [Xanthomendoza sp. 2 TL-2023]